MGTRYPYCTTTLSPTPTTSREEPVRANAARSAGKAAAAIADRERTMHTCSTDVPGQACHSRRVSCSSAAYLPTGSHRELRAAIGGAAAASSIGH
ncbi:hypothetical protein NDU88_007173 [Pleurodeles waltl]|uniref:Uncharacterized protein n=1 Tax=Pleurodeles waltl TaxID=8319 RepID=A0AAV7SRJ8_PLEWA|nr:hypothetical protein NDU88_007173 [Pleurodeles waltl]